MKNKIFYGLCLVQLIVGLGSGYSQSGIALVRHAPVIRGSVEGGVRQMMGEPFALGGGAWISGDCFLPGSPLLKFNGSPIVGQIVTGSGGLEPTGYAVTLSGNAQVGRIFTRTNPSPLPALDPPVSPTGVHNVTLNKSIEGVGDFSTLCNLTLNGNVGQLTIPPGSYGSFVANGGCGFTLGIAGATQPTVYSFQRLSLTGLAQIQLAGPVVITLADSFVLKTAMGSTAMPSWLTLKFAAGDLILEGSAALYGYVINPTGAVTINGHGRLRGGLVADRLTIDGDARLTLIAPPVLNHPPSVSVTSPAEEAIFTAPASITMTAFAEDPDGSIAKVEFYEGTITPMKLGEVTAPPFEFIWSDVRPGTYVLTAKAYDNNGGSSISAARTVTVQQPVPYFTGFESFDGYAPGPLAGQDAWTASMGAAITDTLSYRGDQTMLLDARVPPAEAAHSFGPYMGQSVVFVDMFAKPAAGDGENTSVFVRADVAQIALVRSASQGELRIWDGSAGWRSVGAKVSLEADGQAMDWLRVTIREDFSTKQWDLYIDGKLIAYNAGFVDGTKNIFSQIAFLGSETAASAFDDFYVGFENPLFADVNNDGIDDAWEALYGLSLTNNNRDRVLEGSTVSVIQAYLSGIDPRGDDVNADTDSNGLPDKWEMRYFGRIGVDRDADPNGNGLTNVQEYLLGLNPVTAPPPNAAALVNLRVFAP